MKIALITDAWHPQVNGVVTTLSHNADQLRALGHEVALYTPDRFRTWACPGYREIRLALGCGRALSALLDQFQPDAIHIATEGPLGWAARRYCRRRGFPFTTSFHTRFAEYIHLRSGLPVGWTYAVLRWFHRDAERTLVATPSLIEELAARGFRNLALWSRGVDTQLFRPQPYHNEQPVFLYAGRVAVEKNVEAFLALDLPGQKVVVGDGPQRSELQAKYPKVRFTGYRFGEQLAREIAAADVFVFPSRTDTFGLVMLEALACGVPVAAYPVQGPSDVILNDQVGCLDEDLRKAALKALSLSRAACRAYALKYSWERCARQLENYLAPINRRVSRPVAWWQRHANKWTDAS